MDYVDEVDLVDEVDANEIHPAGEGRGTCALDQKYDGKGRDTKEVRKIRTSVRTHESRLWARTSRCVRLSADADHGLCQSDFQYGLAHGGGCAVLGAGGVGVLGEEQAEDLGGQD